MEDKDASLLVHTHSPTGRSMTLSLSRLVLYFAVVMLLLTYTNLFLACYTSFNCSRFLPTLDYLGCFRGHDRVYIVSLTFYAVSLGICAVGCHRRQKGALSDDIRLVSTISGLLAAVCLPVIAFSDEVNAIHWLPFTSIHWASLALFWPTAVLWASCSYLSLCRLEAAFTQWEAGWMKVLRVLVRLAVFTALLALIEWHFAYTVYADALLNEIGEACCEWVLVGLAILYPALLCQFNRGYVLRFSLETEVKEVELGQI